MKTLYLIGAMTAVCLVSLASLLTAQDTPARNADEQTLRQEVELPTQGVAVLRPTEGSRVQGVILLNQRSDGLHLTGKIVGLSPGRHGFHIHQYGDLRDPQGESAGGHFNPTGAQHGAPGDPVHHAGDLGNIQADQDGVANVDIQVPWLKLHFVVGRSIVVHEGADDLQSQPSGDAGGRAALGVVGIAKPSAPAERTTRSR